MADFPAYGLAISADARFPVAPFFGLLWLDKENSIGFPVDYQLDGKWGAITSQNEPLEGNNQCPQYISACWLSLREETFYFYEAEIQQKNLKKILADFGETDGKLTFVIGLGGMGIFSLWLQSGNKSCIVQSGAGIATYISMRKFMPVRLDLDKKSFCKLILAKTEFSFSDLDYFTMANYTRQYTYRCIISLKKYKEGSWIESEANSIFELDWIEKRSFDGTYDRTHEGGLLQYHQAAIPDIIAIQFHSGKRTYTAYIFIEALEMTELFHKFYGAHPETKSDFIIRIDAEHKKYELAMYRQGLKEPVAIPESAYQLIVFKNKFEDYRSANYNQPQGAWIW